MSRRAMEGTCLAALVRMAIPLCRAAERECPRTGPGRPPDYKDWKIVVLILVAVLKKRKSKSSQYRFLHEHRCELMEWLDLNEFPARSTYFDRYHRAHRLFEVAIRLQGEKAIEEGVAEAETVAVDQSLVPARGPLWHKKDREANRIPDRLRGVDRDSTWGYSPHHGWVQGYSFEVVVTATKDSTVFPLLASADPASASEHVTFGPKIEFLPDETHNVLADSGYDSNSYGERIEYDQQDRRTGRRFICPPNPRGQGKHASKRPRTRKGTPEPKDAPGKRRRKRIAFYESRKGRRIFARRGQTVEPFNEWFKSLFELGDRVWHRGLENNQTQLLAAIFCYQLLVRYNRRRGYENGQIQWILDRL